MASASAPDGELWFDILACTCERHGWRDAATPYSIRWHMALCGLKCDVARCVLTHGHPGECRCIGDLRRGL